MCVYAHFKKIKKWWKNPQFCCKKNETSKSESPLKNNKDQCPNESPHISQKFENSQKRSSDISIGSQPIVKMYNQSKSNDSMSIGPSRRISSKSLENFPNNSINNKSVSSNFHLAEFIAPDIDIAIHENKYHVNDNEKANDAIYDMNDISINSTVNLNVNNNNSRTHVRRNSKKKTTKLVSRKNSDKSDLEYNSKLDLKHNSGFEVKYDSGFEFSNRSFIPQIDRKSDVNLEYEVASKFFNEPKKIDKDVLKYMDNDLWNVDDISSEPAVSQKIFSKAYSTIESSTLNPTTDVSSQNVSPQHPPKNDSSIVHGPKDIHLVMGNSDEKPFDEYSGKLAQKRGMQLNRIKTPDSMLKSNNQVVRD